MCGCVLSRFQLFSGPVDCSPPGSCVHGISQARILERVAISFFQGVFLARDQTRVSCTGRRILYYRATREALSRTSLFYFHLALIAVQNDHVYFFTCLFFIPSTRKEGLSEEDPLFFLSVLFSTSFRLVAPQLAALLTEANLSCTVMWASLSPVGLNQGPGRV